MKSTWANDFYLEMERRGWPVILRPILGRGGAANRTIDYLGILSDPEYMAGELNMIATLNATCN
jgi:hypothetical protein